MTLSLPISRKVTSLYDLVEGDVVVVRDPADVAGTLWCVVLETCVSEPEVLMVAMSSETIRHKLDTYRNLHNTSMPWTSFLDRSDSIGLVSPEDVPDTFWAALARLRLTGEPTVF